MGQILRLIEWAPSLMFLLVAFPYCAWNEMRHRDDRRWSIMLMYLALLLPAICVAAWVSFHLSVAFSMRLDQYLEAFDSSFGSPSFVLGSWVDRHAIARAFLVFIYESLLPASWAVIAVCLWTVGKDEARRVFTSIVLSTLLVIPLYCLFPASGPLYAFKSYPFFAPHLIAPHVINLTSVPNCVPSEHLSIALLLFYYMRRWWWGILSGGAYCFLIACATLGLGEHYVFDLLVAVPYTALILWLTPDDLFVRHERERSQEQVHA